MDLKKIKPLFWAILQVIIGAVFIFSGVTKLLAIERLEFAIVENIHLKWFYSMIAARLVIAFELFLGIHLILFHDRSWNKKLSFFTLLIFTAYLLWLYVLKGNEADCGCFGKALILNTFQSLIKNLVLILLNGVLLFHKDGIVNRILPGYFQFLVLASSLSVVFVVAPVYTSMEERNPDITLDWKLVYEHPTNLKPGIDLTQGKHVIAFLSTSCVYCQRAAYKLSLLHQTYPDISIWFFVNGDDAEIAEFLAKTKSESIPYTKYLGPKDFRALAGNVLPTIYWIENGKVVYKRFFDEIMEDDYEKWKD